LIWYSSVIEKRIFCLIFMKYFYTNIFITLNWIQRVFHGAKSGIEYTFYHEKIKFICSSHIVISFCYTDKGVSTNFITNCCSSAAGISWSSLFSYSLARNYFNKFKSYEGFLFSVTFSSLLGKLPNFCANFVLWWVYFSIFECSKVFQMQLI